MSDREWGVLWNSLVRPDMRVHEVDPFHVQGLPPVAVFATRDQAEAATTGHSKAAWMGYREPGSRFWHTERVEKTRFSEPQPGTWDANLALSADVVPALDETKMYQIWDGVLYASGIPCASASEETMRYLRNAQRLGISHNRGGRAPTESGRFA